MDKKLLKEQLKDLQVVIRHKIPYINYGGCVHFAYFLAKKLEELKIEYKVVLSNYKSDSTELPDFEYDIFTVSHVQIYVTGIGCIDGISIRPLSAMKRNKDIKFYSLNLDQLNYYRSIDGWNSAYNVKNNSSLFNYINHHIYG